MMRQKLFLLLILLLYFALGIAYSITIPLGEGVDEIDHLLYVEHIQRFGMIPVLHTDYSANYTREAHQPPFYYLLAANLVNLASADLNGNLFPVNDCYTVPTAEQNNYNLFLHSPAEKNLLSQEFLGFRLLRLLALLMGAGTILLAFRFGSLMTEERIPLGLLTAGLVAFTPQFIFVTNIVNNDSLAILLGAAIMVQSMRILRKTDRTRTMDVLFLALLLATGFITKTSLVALWPPALLALLWRLRAELGRMRAWPVRAYLLLGILVGVPAIVEAAWLYSRYVNYGSPRMLEVMVRAEGSYIRQLAPLTIFDLLRFVQSHFKSFWLTFGWFNLELPAAYYGVFAIVVGLSLAGIVANMRQGFTGVSKQAVFFCGFAVACTVFALLLYANVINWTAYQGRLTYIALLPIFGLLALGLLTVSQRLALATTGGLFAVSLLAIPTIIKPAYEQVYLSPIEDRPIYSRCAYFENGFLLTQLNLPAQVCAGSDVAVMVTGNGMLQQSEEQTLRVEVKAAGGTPLAASSSRLAWSDPGKITSEIAVGVPANVMPTDGFVVVGFVNEDGEWRQATNFRQQAIPLPAAPMAIDACSAR